MALHRREHMKRTWGAPNPRHRTPTRQNRLDIDNVDIRSCLGRSCVG